MKVATLPPVGRSVSPYPESAITWAPESGEVGQGLTG
jgi:hypothetical protein